MCEEPDTIAINSGKPLSEVRELYRSTLDPIGAFLGASEQDADPAALVEVARTVSAARLMKAIRDGASPGRLRWEVEALRHECREFAAASPEGVAATGS